MCYAEELSNLDESVRKLKEFFEVLWVHDARIGLKINFKKTKSLSLEISEDKKEILVDEKID